ncbi:MAG: tripartite tricarboxylate transporter substrate binding protein [Proteobacteria bacterium]|nr:tripartite tricarboxylate transporter substrate binding protein [Pseudomonadota bacterium]
MRLWVTGVAAAAIALVSYSALAQRYPEKTIRFIAPYAPGGSTDLLTRTLAQKLTEYLGQTVVADNRPGAGGNVGAEIAAKSAPDGYTILLAPVSPMAINVTLYGKKLPFNPEKDFAPITLVAKVPLVVVVNLAVPVKTLQEFIMLAKSRPGKMTYGSSGNGSSNHMTGAMLMSAAQLDMVHVPYKGGGPGMIALLGGEIDMMVAQIPSSRQLHMSGKVRALALSGAKRSAALPDVPTMIESGLPGFEATSWYCVVAPAGTPKAIIDRLHAEIVKALNTPEMRQRLADDGAEVESSTPAELARFVHAEIAKWAKAVKDSGARID